MITQTARRIVSERRRMTMTDTWTGNAARARRGDNTWG